MKKTRRQLEEDLRQAEQDLDFLRREAANAHAVLRIVGREYDDLRKQYTHLLGWAVALRRHFEKDILPKGLL